MAFLTAGVQKKVFSISNFFRHKVSSQINWVKSKTQIFPHPSYILKSEASGLQHEIKNWVDDIKVEG
jgi:hypothetical protein